MTCKLMAVLTVLSSIVVFALSASGEVPPAVAILYIALIVAVQFGLDVLRTRARIRERTRPHG